MLSSMGTLEDDACFVVFDVHPIAKCWDAAGKEGLDQSVIDEVSRLMAAVPWHQILSHGTDTQILEGETHTTTETNEQTHKPSDTHETQSRSSSRPPDTAPHVRAGQLTR